MLNSDSYLLNNTTDISSNWRCLSILTEPVEIRITCCLCRDPRAKHTYPIEKMSTIKKGQISVNCNTCQKERLQILMIRTLQSSQRNTSVHGIFSGLDAKRHAQHTRDVHCGSRLVLFTPIFCATVFQTHWLDGSWSWLISCWYAVCAWWYDRRYQSVATDSKSRLIW